MKNFQELLGKKNRVKEPAIVLTKKRPKKNSEKSGCENYLAKWPKILIVEKLKKMKKNRYLKKLKSYGMSRNCKKTIEMSRNLKKKKCREIKKKKSNSEKNSEKLHHNVEKLKEKQEI